MTSAPSPPWFLPCVWCDYVIEVNARSGAGEEAARMMERHLERQHGRSWREFLHLGGVSVPKEHQ